MTDLCNFSALKYPLHFYKAEMNARLVRGPEWVMQVILYYIPVGYIHSKDTVVAFVGPGKLAGLALAEATESIEAAENLQRMRHS